MHVPDHVYEEPQRKRGLEGRCVQGLVQQGLVDLADRPQHVFDRRRGVEHALAVVGDVLEVRIVQVGHAVELQVVRPAGTLHKGVREVVGQCTVQDFDCGRGLGVGRWRGLVQVNFRDQGT